MEISLEKSVMQEFKTLISFLIWNRNLHYAVGTYELLTLWTTATWLLLFQETLLFFSNKKLF